MKLIEKFVACGGLVIIAIPVVVYILGRNVWVNGVLYNSVESAEEGVLNSYEPLFVQDDLNEYVTYSVDMFELKGRGMFKRFTDWLQSVNYDVELARTVDVTGIREHLNRKNENGVVSEDAYIAQNDETYYIVPEVVGTIIDVNRLIDDIGSSTLDVNDYKIKPSVISADLEETCNSLINYVNWSVAYDNGSVIKASKDSVTYSKDEGIILNYDFLNEMTDSIADEYDTVGSPRTFTTNSGEIIEVKGGTWGSIVNKEDELNFLKSSFETCTSVRNRRPTFEYEREAFGDTYIEVSIEDQHMWLYKNGVLVSDSNVVTGTKSRHDTPTGAYFISERKKGKYLTGDTYRTWVDRWMRITNQGHGLHDASWRGRFGGNIYEYDGSHGCINLPHKYACELYERVYWGMPVVIY